MITLEVTFNPSNEGDSAMDSWSKMLPWMNVRMPASGDVFMNYNPWTNWGWSASDAGDPDIENEVFANVALPGKQLGKLTEAVLALIDFAEKADPEVGKGESEQTRAIRDFRDLADKIQATIKARKGTLEGDAENALLRLKRADRQAFDEIIKREYKEVQERPS